MLEYYVPYAGQPYLKWQTQAALSNVCDLRQQFLIEIPAQTFF